MERMADVAGARGGRYIQIDRRITRQEIDSGAANPDCIYVFQRGKDKPAYEVPYRALLPEKVEGLLVVGKATAGGAQLRTAHGVLFQGQAAGTAASMAVKAGVAPRAMDISKLQDALRSAGVQIPARSRPQ
jgi:FAD-dependent oxidoreductase family protein